MTTQSEGSESVEQKKNNYTEHQIHARLQLHSRVSSSPLVNIGPARGTNRELVAATLPPQELTCLSLFPQPVAAQN